MHLLPVGNAPVVGLVSRRTGDPLPQKEMKGQMVEGLALQPLAAVVQSAAVTTTGSSLMLRSQMGVCGACKGPEMWVGVLV